jgi:nucleotide-binding universal stress UspA family protein
MNGIVVGVDGSPSAMAALRWAAGQAETMEQPLTVVTVVDPAALSALWTDSPEDATRSAHLDAARREIELMLEKLEGERGRPLTGPVTVRARIGHPVDELVAAAEDADLLVVGSRGAGVVSRALLGSVSTGVVHHAPCTVVVVRGDDEPDVEAAV